MTNYNTPFELSCVCIQERILFHFLTFPFKIEQRKRLKYLANEISECAVKIKMKIGTKLRQERELQEMQHSSNWSSKREERPRKNNQISNYGSTGKNAQRH